jgi:hypothetical protein
MLNAPDESLGCVSPVLALIVAGDDDGPPLTVPVMTAWLLLQVELSRCATGGPTFSLRSPLVPITVMVMHACDALLHGLVVKALEARSPRVLRTAMQMGLPVSPAVKSAVVHWWLVLPPEYHVEPADESAEFGASAPARAPSRAAVSTETSP